MADLLPVSFPLQTTMGPCPKCHASVLLRTWKAGVGWKEIKPPISPLLGEAHQCCAVEKEGKDRP